MIKRYTADLYLTVYEKLILALGVAAISSILLYTYNVYSKAFEAAQAQSNVASILSSKFRGIVLEQSGQILSDVKASYYAGDRLFAKEKIDVAYGLTLDIENRGRLVAQWIPKSQVTSQHLVRSIRTFLPQLGSQLMSADVVKFEDEVTNLQANFLRISSDEIERLVLSEFGLFVGRFESNIPWVLRPHIIFFLAVLGIALSTIGMIWLSKSFER